MSELHPPCRDAVIQLGGVVPVHEDAVGDAMVAVSGSAPPPITAL